MKIKNNNKGKVYPSPSSSSSSSSAYGDYLSVLKLLPAAILALASVLPLEDREVLAYLVTRSIKTSTTTTTSSSGSASSSSSSLTHKKSSKKSSANGATAHKPPVFDCECFDCYTSYWFRWDSSANRELIHQAIEAFEDHLANGESEKSKKNAKSKRRDKTARRLSETPLPAPVVVVQKQVEEKEIKEPSTTNAVIFNEVLPLNDVAPVSPPSPPKKELACVENAVFQIPQPQAAAADSAPKEEEEETMALVRTTTATHKGLARKVLPDLLGLLNSRLWSLWSPNV